MRLDLGEEDEEAKPTCLTPGYLNTLMNAKTKQKGVLQILSLKKKKDLAYSTRLSDGFFEAKVMVVQEAAKQLAGQEVSIYDVIEAEVRNHGGGIVVIKDRMKFWPFSKQIGNPSSWYEKKQSTSQGSNLIIWESQGLSIVHCNKSHKSKSEKKSQTMQQIEEEGNHNRLQTNTRTLTMEQSEGGKQQSFQHQFKQDNPPLMTDSMQTLSMEVGSKIEEKHEGKQVSARMQEFLNVLFDSDEESIIEEKTEQPKENNKSGFKLNSKVDLQFIFNGLCDNNQQQQPQNISPKEEQKQANEDDDLDDVSAFLDWMNQKKAETTQVKTPERRELRESMRESVLKKKQEMYKYLMDSSSSQEQQYKIKSQFHHPLPNLLCPQTEKVKQVESLPYQIELKFKDIYHGLSTSMTNWWMKATARCVSEVYPKDYVHAVLTNETSEYFIHAVFTQYSQLQVSLEEGKAYRLGKGSIKTDWTTNQCQIEFDCSKCLIEPQEQQGCEEKESSSNYMAIDKIFQLNEGEMVNIFGLIKSVKQFQTKNGPTTCYQIVDPIIGYGVSLTKFDSKLDPATLSELQSAVITVYWAYVGSYKGKKNLVAKTKTILKVNWLPLTAEAHLLRQWLQDECNSLQTVDWNLVGFIECDSLSQIKSTSQTQLYIKNATIVGFSSKFTYPACVRCFKKVINNVCRSCGKRNQNEVVERIFLRGHIGDDSTVLSVIWTESLAHKMLVNGYQNLEDRWVLKKVEVWLERGSNDFVNVLKAKQTKPKDRIEDLFAYLNSRIL